MENRDSAHHAGAAIDDKVGAGDPGGFTGTEVGGGVGDIIGYTQAADGAHVLAHVCLDFGIFEYVFGRHVGGDRSRADDVQAHALGGEFSAQVAGHQIHGGLEGTIVIGVALGFAGPVFLFRPVPASVRRRPAGTR